MNKFAAPAVVAMLCALALVSPAAGMYSGPPENAPSVQAGAFGPRTVTLGPSGTADDGGAPDVETGTGSPLAPAVEPVITPASPAGEGTSGTAAAPPTATVAAPETATSEPLAPEPPSLPPLWAPDAELSQNKTAAPTPPTPATESITTESLGTEALVPDSNTAAILTVFNEINNYRAANSLAPVKYHPTVAGMAQEWSDSIASRDVIEHRASFWTDPRALSPNNGAGEVIAIRTDRNAAQLVEWWKNSEGHNAMLLDPRFNVMGAGISYTNNLYTIWGVVNFFGYTTLPAGTVTSPGGSSAGGGAFPAPTPTVCDPSVKHMPPTLDLGSAAITSAADLVTINASGQLINRPSTGNRTFGAAKVIGSGFGTAKEVFTTDWDRDGAYDLLTQWNDGRLTLHRGIATGGFQTSFTLGSGGWATLTLAVGGWCANNRLPQLVALDTAGNLYLYPNVGLADMSSRTTMATGVSARKLSMVDYDADGFQDLLAIRSDGGVQLYRGAGTPAPRVEARLTVTTGWQDVTGIRPLRDVTALNSTGVALRRANDVVQYWDLSSGSLASPSNITGSWAGQRLAQ
ncbi:CAP domain-containing protein [Pseudarthrobacter raffinosi]|uniref:CAP domain-containing protein n=1 Tax=Pseudarthrobacter raffinosi TaxID=2953651 RepID=UPI0027E264BD|nr:CAP domain-containing protein [Pseudarthrobacter sp. MDT3-28]